MKKHRVSSFTKGWFIGDFAPTLMRTKEFEAAVKNYVAGDTEASHIHPVAREFTVIGSGKFRMNAEILEAGDVVELSPGESSDFECLESGVTFVVKSPSLAGDKVMTSPSPKGAKYMKSPSATDAKYPVKK